MSVDPFSFGIFIWGARCSWVVGEGGESAFTTSKAFNPFKTGLQHKQLLREGGGACATEAVAREVEVRERRSVQLRRLLQKVVCADLR